MDWIKLMCNILDHRKIKMIRKGPEGDTLVLLWLLMLAEAGKCNRGGYLMISDNTPYTAVTLSMVTDINLPTVQLGLATFVGFEMIDEQDDMIYIRNWGKYQSEDKLEARREKDRERKQKQRQNERKKLGLKSVVDMSRDSHDDMSRYVTPENRTDETREEKTTTTTAVAVDQLLKKLPTALHHDSEVRSWITNRLTTMGNEYVTSNIEATITQSNKNPKAFLKKALEQDFGETYRAKRKAAEENARKSAQISAQEKENEQAQEIQLSEARKIFDALPEPEREKILAEARRISPSQIYQMVEGIALDIVNKNYRPSYQAFGTLIKGDWS